MKKENGVQFCEATTMALIETDAKLMSFYHAGIHEGESEVARLSLIFTAAVEYQPEDSEHVRTYKELAKEYQYSTQKMKVFSKQDKLLSFVLEGLLSGHEEEEALKLLFYSYVLEDVAMRIAYKNVGNEIVAIQLNDELIAMQKVEEQVQNEMMVLQKIKIDKWLNLFELEILTGIVNNARIEAEKQIDFNFNDCLQEKTEYSSDLQEQMKEKQLKLDQLIQEGALPF